MNLEILGGLRVNQEQRIAENAGKQTHHYYEAQSSFAAWMDAFSCAHTMQIE